MKKKTTEQFILDAVRVHGDRYDYSKVNYTGSFDKITIICSKHGEFKITPDNHLSKVRGCTKCSGRYRKNTRDFIEESILINKDRYDYSKVNYINAFKKVELICKKHGSFLQSPNNHLSKKMGCPICKSSQGEKEISFILNENDVEFIPQKVFFDCRNKNPLPFDFYLPNINTCIEYDGRQHFEEVSFFGGKEGLIRTQLSDKIKNEYYINLLRIKYTENIKDKMRTIYANSINS